MVGAEIPDKDSAGMGAIVCWSTSSTADPGSSEWLPRDVGRLQQAHATGQEVDCLRVRERMGRRAGAKAVKKRRGGAGQRVRSSSGVAGTNGFAPLGSKAHCRSEQPACSRIGFEMKRACSASTRRISGFALDPIQCHSI